MLKALQMCLITSASHSLEGSKLMDTSLTFPFCDNTMRNMPSL